MKSKIILSCAGGGKTTKLIEYIKKLLDLNIKSERILVLSFSNTTANIIREKLNINALTLHTFILNIMNNNKIPTSDINEIIDNVLYKYSFLRSEFSTNTIKTLIKRAMCCHISKKNMNLNLKDQKINNVFSRIVAEINKEYHIRGYVHLSQLCKDFLTNINDYLEYIYHNYDYICIDEAQDFSLIQLKIIENLILKVFLENDKGFIIVGDKKQSIYSFQGVWTQYFELFCKKIYQICKYYNHDIEIIKSLKTYRFGANISNFINNYLKIPHIVDQNKKDFCQLSSGNNVLKKVVKKIKEILLKDSNGTIAVIYTHYSKLIYTIQNVCKSSIYLSINITYYEIYKIFHIIYMYFVSYGEKYKTLLASYKIDVDMLVGSPILQLEYLFDKFFGNSYLDIAIQQRLKYIAEFSCNFVDFFLNIPEKLNLYINHNRVIFSTIHNAKGMEYDYVIYVDNDNSIDKFKCLNGIFKVWTTKNEVYDDYFLHLKQQEKKNLHYTALTRAKKYLYVISDNFK